MVLKLVKSFNDPFSSVRAFSLNLFRAFTDDSSLNCCGGDAMRAEQKPAAILQQYSEDTFPASIHLEGSCIFTKVQERRK